MLTPLLLMVTGFTCFFVVVLLLRVRSEIVAAKIRAIRLMQIHGSQESPLADRMAG